MSAAIEVRDLRFTYGEGIEALRGVSFSIADGEMTPTLNSPELRVGLSEEGNSNRKTGT